MPGHERFLKLLTTAAIPAAALAGSAATGRPVVEQAQTCTVVSQEDIRKVGGGSVLDAIKAVPAPGSKGGSCTQPPPPKLNVFDRSILDAHNVERKSVGAAPLRWNYDLARHASEYATQLARIGELVHAPREGRAVERENLQRGLIGWSPQRMVQDWTREKRLFRPGLFPSVCDGDWSQCAHYTQIIWPTTTDLGCGVAPGGGFQWLVCRYSPGGNKEGKPVGTSAEAKLSNDTAGNKWIRARVIGGDYGTREAQENPIRHHWIDAKTGEVVTAWPVVWNDPEHPAKGVHHVRPIATDPNRAYDPASGRNFVFQDGEWIDAKTGEAVTSWPVVWNDPEHPAKGVHRVRPSVTEPDRAHDPESGRNFERVPMGLTAEAAEVPK